MENEMMRRRRDVDYASNAMQARRVALLAAGKAKLRNDIATGNQSTVRHAIEWPFVPNGTATEFQTTGRVVKFRVPIDGVYLLSAHGASGATVRHLFKTDVRQGGAFVQNKGVREFIIAIIMHLIIIGSSVDHHPS